MVATGTEVEQIEDNPAPLPPAVGEPGPGDDHVEHVHHIGHHPPAVADLGLGGRQILCYDFNLVDFS